MDETLTKAAKSGRSRQMAYLFIGFVLLVILATTLVFPPVVSALPVLIAIFPLMALNIVAGWIFYHHYTQQHRQV
jgi:hypothetical protein